MAIKRGALKKGDVLPEKGVVLDTFLPEVFTLVSRIEVKLYRVLVVALKETGNHGLTSGKLTGNEDVLPERARIITI